MAACGAAVLAVHSITASPSGPVHAASAAYAQGQNQGQGAGGWGKGGYTMMPGPAGSANTGTGSANTGTGGATNGAVTQAAATSMNWAGYAAAGTPGQFTSVSSSWSEPAVTCGAQNTFSSFWVGLDGDGTTTVEQTGTEADCSNGAATYAGWYEVFPAAPVFYNNPVQPGDAMSASVVSSGGGNFTLTLNDTTQGWSQVTHQSAPNAQLGSAEVIAEAPSSGTVLPLANFGTVNFANADANGQALGGANPTALTMVSANNTDEATPSALNGNNAFSVTWDSSGTAAAAGTTGTAGVTGTAGAGATPTATAPATSSTPVASPAP